MKTGKGLGGLTPLKKALEALLQAPPPTLKELEKDPLEARGHVLSRDVVAYRGVPPWRRAGLDGYAVRAGETPGELELVDLRVSRDPRREPPSLPEGGAAYTPTGAFLPRGADSLVPLELSERRGNRVRLPRAVVGRNVDWEASLVEEGGLLLSRGSVVTTARAVGLLDAGVDRVWVWERMRIPIFTLGVEEGMRDTTGPLLEWLFSLAPWVEARWEGSFPGGPGDLAGLVEEMARDGSVHALVLAGRVGPGVDDFFEKASGSLGARVVVRGVALKGARPFTFFYAGRMPVLWLPGMPTSAAVSFLSLVLPLLEAWGRVGGSWREEAFRRVVVENPEEAGDRRVAFAVLTGPCRARLLERRFLRSSSVVSLALAQGLVFLDAREEGWGGGAWFLPLVM